MKKKFKKKVQKESDAPNSETPSEAGAADAEAKMDQNYYDLDDDFIDDEEIDMID